MMSDDTSDYNLKAIRKLLTRSFGDTRKLRRFLQERPQFQPILDMVNRDASLADHVDEIIDYCGSQLLVDLLLEEVRSHNPRQYSRYGPYHRSTDSIYPETGVSETQQPLEQVTAAQAVEHAEPHPVPHRTAGTGAEAKERPTRRILGVELAFTESKDAQSRRWTITLSLIFFLLILVCIRVLIAKWPPWDIRTPTPTMVAIVSNTPTPTDTLTRTPADTPTPAPTDTPIPIPTTPIPIPTDTLTPTPADTSTAIPSNTPIPTSPTPTPTDTPTPTPTDTPTLTERPNLLQPEWGETLTGRYTFRWHWDGPPLKENQAFQLLIWSEQEHKTGAPRRGAAAPTRDTELMVVLQFVPAIRDYGSGNYYWTVALVQELPDGTLTRLAVQYPRKFVYRSRRGPGR
jgi:hypothetical protein